MIALVVGGASSGKSAFAEDLALGLPGPHWYVATMAAGGAEAARRIGRHRRLRAGKGFVTLEVAGATGLDLAALCQGAGVRGGTALVEDLGNLVATRLFFADGSMAPAQEVLSGCLEDLGLVEGRVGNLVLVGNLVGSDGMAYDEATSLYLRLLGGLTCRLAAGSDLVVEVVCGQPNVLRGGEVLESL